VTGTGALGLHATKIRWEQPTLAGGLVRPSAAWFMIDDSFGPVNGPATWAAAVYLALGPSGRAALAQQPDASASDVFATRPDLLPVLLVFHDEPTGDEIRHRYLWFGPRLRSAPTAPYTKVERAGRRVAGPLRVRTRLAVSVPDTAHAEQRIAIARSGWGDHEPPLARVPADGWDRVEVGAATRVSALCEGLGELLWSRWHPGRGSRERERAGR